MSNNEIIFLGVGFVLGIIFVSIFWWAHCEDLQTEADRLKIFIQKHIKNY